MTNQLNGSVVSRSEVDPAMMDELYDLFFRYYNEIDRETFDQDLDEKDWILLLIDSAGGIKGFTTMKLYELQHDGSTIRVIFSGNTIVDQKHWGDHALMKTWGKFMAERKCEYPDVRLYWYLICSGYRTYLFLPFFFKDFYPCRNEPTPDYERNLIDVLGTMKFPREYRDGIVRVRSPRECLHSELAIPPNRKLKNQHVRYFIEKNPDYLRGNELVCITEFSLQNNMRLARACLVEEMAKQVESNFAPVKVGDH